MARCPISGILSVSEFPTIIVGQVSPISGACGEDVPPVVESGSVAGWESESMRILRIVSGVLALLVGAVFVAGAIAGFSEDRDADDFFVSDGHRFVRSSFAVTSEGVDVLGDAPGWVADRLTDPVDIRVRGA